jgi:hypothetical protein
MTHLVQEDILPIIMIRDPLLWMQSMVRRYLFFLGAIFLVFRTHGFVEYHSTNESIMFIIFSANSSMEHRGDTPLVIVPISSQRPMICRD